MIEQLNVTKTISTNADQTWAAISSIGGIDRWFPMITGCSVSGTVEVRKVNDDSSEVSWTVEFDVEEEQRDAMIEFLHIVLAQGIQGLEQDLLQPQLV